MGSFYLQLVRCYHDEDQFPSADLFLVSCCCIFLFSGGTREEMLRVAKEFQRTEPIVLAKKLKKVTEVMIGPTMF